MSKREPYGKPLNLCSIQKWCFILTPDTHRTTGAFDERKLTLMLDRKFEVTRRVGFGFLLVKFEEQDSSIL